ncbi:unnamed protein product [Closterium sp. NIES-53]
MLQQPVMRRFQHTLQAGALGTIQAGRRAALGLKAAALSLPPASEPPSRRAAAHFSTPAAPSTSRCCGSTAQNGSVHSAVRARAVTAQIRRGRSAGESTVQWRMEADGSTIANAFENATRATCVTRAMHNADGAQSQDASSEVNGVEQTPVKSGETEQTDREDVVDGFRHKVGELLRWAEEEPPAGYRPNVGLCIVNQQGLVLVASRLDQPDTWQMPQVRVSVRRGGVSLTLFPFPLLPSLPDLASPSLPLSSSLPLPFSRSFPPSSLSLSPRSPSTHARHAAAAVAAGRNRRGGGRGRVGGGAARAGGGDGHSAALRAARGRGEAGPPFCESMRPPTCVSILASTPLTPLTPSPLPFLPHSPSPPLLPLVLPVPSNLPFRTPTVYPRWGSGCATATPRQSFRALPSGGGGSGRGRRSDGERRGAGVAEGVLRWMVVERSYVEWEGKGREMGCCRVAAGQKERGGR